MACPFFRPIDRLDEGAWTHAPRLPLGDPYRGTCHARPGEVLEAPEAQQRDLCNCGYVRGRCDRFPADSAADAVRFSVVSDRDGQVQLVYVLEKDHSPVKHGLLDNAPVSELLSSQARAFLQSYRRRSTPP